MTVTIKDFIGYLMGLLLFVILIPFVMLKVSGEIHPSMPQIVCLAIMAIVGIGLSVWTIIHMKRVGKGNPMDVFNHEIAPRTENLMTDGPYRVCRNPMLLGVLIYYAGIIVCLATWQSAVVFLAYFVIIMIQVRQEEKRLQEDFGEAYLEYCKNTKKLIPFIW